MKVCLFTFSSPEMVSPDFGPQAVEFLGSNTHLIGILFLGGVAHWIRREALKKSGYRCTVTKEESDLPHEGMLEASHTHHSQNDKWRQENGLPPYNSAAAVRIECTAHHLEEHEKNAGKNGLSFAENNRAIGGIRGRLNIWRAQNGKRKG